MDRAIDGPNLFLAYGDFERNDKSGTDIGNEIVAALHEKGFKTKWNGNIEDRIEVIDIKWQKRFGNNSCSTERAIDLLSNYDEN